MAHRMAKRDFDFVAFDRDYTGSLNWEYSPRSLATAKAKARREGYQVFFTVDSSCSWKDGTKALPASTDKINMYVWDDTRWIKG
jgi:hypothetical protein